MKIEFKIVMVYEAFDNQEWGSSWGRFTTEEEARAEVEKQQTKWTRGIVRKKYIEIPVNNF